MESSNYFHISSLSAETVISHKLMSHRASQPWRWQQSGIN